MKKTIYIIIALILLLLLIFNFRTPFLTKEKSGWSIGFGHFESLEDSNNIKSKHVFSIETLKSIDSTTVFLADPFYVFHKDIYYLFFEHQKENTNADISLMTSSDGVNYEYDRTVLDEDFHLSYPQVFKYEDEFYMVPESQAAHNVLLYKAFNFPYDWKIVDTLIKDIKLKDPSIYLSENFNVLLASDDDMNLHVYHSQSLFKDWKLHQQEIALMGTEARPGGRFIKYKEDLYIPIQNSTHGYGYGLSLYKFEYFGDDYKMTREYPLHLKANANITEFNAGMHHLDFQFIENQYYAVYDGNTLKEDGKTILNIRGPIKWNYLDLLNWSRN